MTNPTEAMREEFEKAKTLYHAQWSEPEFPITSKEDSAYEAGFNDGFQAADEKYRALRQSLKYISKTGNMNKADIQNYTDLLLNGFSHDDALAKLQGGERE